MWRLFLLIGVFIGLGLAPLQAQEWSGTAALGLSSGHRTNLYLDPVIGTWNPDADSPFFAVTPQLGLARNARRTRFDLTVRGRIDLTNADIPQFTRSTFRIRRRLHPNWTLGLSGGGTRYRYPGASDLPRTVRDSWWGLPSLQWTPTDNTMLNVRTGLTQRIEQRPDFTDRQTSGLVSLRATHWLTDRVQGGVRAYYSSGRTSEAETDFGGTGGSVDLTYWPSSSVSVQGEVALNQPRYETRISGTVRDRIGRLGIEAEWSPRSFLTLFGRGRVLSADLERGTDRTDEYVSAGLRLNTQRVFGGAAEPLSSQRRVCASVENGLRLRIPYDGEGRPHITGDFNNWSLPGIPMTAAGDDRWTTTLDLPPGRYEYRLRVVADSNSRWLDLPPYAQTTKGTFGDTNGACTTQ